MKRFSLATMAVLTIASLAWVVAIPSASARIRPNLTINSQVTMSTTKNLGGGKIFELGSCTSSNPAVVSCEIWNPAPPNGEIRFLCAAPTSNPVTLTVTYLATDGRPALSPTAIAVHCKAAHEPTRRAPAYISGPVLKGSPPGYRVAQCVTDLTGAQCLPSGESITRSCPLGVLVNTLPALSDARVTLSSADPTLNGMVIDLPFKCR